MTLSKLQEMVEERGAWHAAVRRITKSQTQLSNWATDYRKQNQGLIEDYSPSFLRIGGPRIFHPQLDFRIVNSRWEPSFCSSSRGSIDYGSPAPFLWWHDALLVHESLDQEKTMNKPKVEAVIHAPVSWRLTHLWWMNDSFYVETKVKQLLHE